MATTTPNFGWAVPTSTDLVKDGAVAIETLGDAIDASLVDLKGGTTGQVLAKASNTDMDFTWATDASGIPATIFDAKGDIIAASAADTAARLAVGANNTVLTADSSTATGLKWATPAGGGGGMTFISRTSFSDVASQNFDSVFTSSYEIYYAVIEFIYAATDSDDFHIQLRAGATTKAASYYGATAGWGANGTANSTGTSNQAAFIASADIGSSGYSPSGTLYFGKVGNTSERPNFWGTLTNTGGGAYNNVFGGINIDADTYTGFVLKSSSSNITGAVTLFGVNKA